MMTGVVVTVAVAVVEKDGVIVVDSCGSKFLAIGRAFSAVIVVVVD